MNRKSLVLCILLLLAAVLAQPCWAAFTISNHGLKEVVGTSVTTPSFNQAAGDLLYVACFSQAATTAHTVSDLNGDTFTLINSQKDTTNGSNYFTSWYAVNVTAKTGNTITCQGGSGSQTATIAYMDLAGAAAASPLDAHSTVKIADNSGSCTTNSITTINPIDFVVTTGLEGQTGNAATNWSASSGYTIEDTLNSNGQNLAFGIDAYRITSSSGAYTDTLNNGGNPPGGNWMCEAVAFNSPASGSTPSISSLSPTSGAVGTSVTISGSNFGSSQGSSTVKFNGTAATAGSWTTGSITATVPLGATTGNVVVTVNGVASNGVSFTVTTPALTISNHSLKEVVGTSVTTPSFNQAAGDLLYVACFSQAATTAHAVSDLNGDTFTLINSQRDTAGSNYFTSWYAINVTAKTGNTITCQGGSGSQTATIAYIDLAGAATVSALDAHSTVNIADNSSTCTTNSITTTNAVDFVVTTGLEGETGNAATNWSASSGYTIEDTLNPTGQNNAFGIDAYRITSSSGAYTDTLNNGGNPPGGNWMCEAVAFNSPASGSTPSISSLSPTSGAVGTSVTITGTNFGSSQGTGGVKFNGTAATVNSWSATSITASVPTGATTGNVVVTAAGGAASNGVSFTVLSTPSISSLTPSSAAVGSTIVIAGSNFGSSQGSSTVKFNGTTASVGSWTAGSITATVPSGATTGNVVVTVNGVASNGVSFTVTASPSISSLSPTSGPVGISVTITGTNFGSSQGNGGVTFNGTAATVNSWSNTSITATVPTGATTGNVVVTAAGGLASNGVSFTVSAAVAYNFKVTYAPNGDVLTANDSVNGNWTYTYDDFNRLATANNSSPVQGFSYAYDELGNRWQQNLTAGSGGTSNLTFSNYSSATTNGNCYHAAGRTNQPDSSCYDAAGNLLNDGSHSYTYDAENRLISVDSGTTATYTYDGDGRRVRKVSAAGTENYFYDLQDRPITELSDGGAYIRGEVYAGSRHLATYQNGTTYFNQEDWLGTERSRLALNGSQCETITSLAFGDGLATTGTCGDPSPNHFTGKERDPETGLDDFGARYYGSSIGRFITPDWSAKPQGVPYAVLDDPQSLNLYSYVRNNPLSRIDPDGHEVVLTGDQKDKQEEQKRIVQNASKKGEAALFKTVTGKDGKTRLVLDKKAAADFQGKHSKGYNMLVQTIDNKHTATVVMDEHDSRTQSDGHGNATVYLDRNVAGIDRVAPMRDANGTVIPNPFNIIAGHELLGHARLNMLGDPGYRYDGPGSKTFQIENDLRKEQGIPLRPNDAP